jgi:hypothetical protein
MKKSRRPKEPPAHDTPTLGPRARPGKVRPVAPAARRGQPYEPGVPPPRPGDPWLDEGMPESNG